MISWWYPFFYGFVFPMGVSTLLWILSVFLVNVSIVDSYWGMGFSIASTTYYYMTENAGIGFFPRKILVNVLVWIWALRLSIFLTWRNWGEGEDYRYQGFRKKYGEKSYWWFSFIQVFLLQTVLLWLISSSLLSAQFYDVAFNAYDLLAFALVVVGLFFESVGDFQLAAFRGNPTNKGKVLNTGLWRYTRHPNYFGNAVIWWGFGIFSVAVGSYTPLLGSVLMTFLLLKISGVAMLEHTLKKTKPKYADYIKSTNSFFPWFPRKN